MKKLLMLVVILVFAGELISPQPTTLMNSQLLYFESLDEILDFDKAFEQIARYEGGYVNDPNDSGGETYAGISRRSHSKWSGWKFIDQNKPIRYNKTFEYLEKDVYLFYKERYWYGINIDRVNNQKLAEELFDVSVNMGSGRAVMFLKKSMNELSKNRFTMIKVDNILDSCTLSLLHRYKNDTVFMNELSCMVNRHQKNRYLQIVEHNPSKSIYIKSWMRRC